MVVDSLHTAHELVKFFIVLFFSIKLSTMNDTWECFLCSWNMCIFDVVTAIKQVVHVRVVCFHTVSMAWIGWKVKRWWTLVTLVNVAVDSTHVLRSRLFHDAEHR